VNGDSQVNILMLNYEFPPIGGGTGKVSLSLLRQYANNSELKVDVLTSAPRPGFFKEKFSRNITIYKVGLHKKHLHLWLRREVVEWLIKAQFYYYRLLRKDGYNLVHAFSGFPAGWLCYRSASRLPYIISLQGSSVPGYNTRLGIDYKLLTGLFRRIWSGASVVVANSKGLQKLALEFMSDLDTRAISNGVDTEIFYPSEKQGFSGTLKALTACRLIERKRIDLLVRAVAIVKEAGFDIQLTVAGEGNLLGQLQGLADKLNVADSVFFRGIVSSERMPQLYRDNDIFLMASIREGMSEAMLEAMASGLPVVSARCEGVEELISDNGIVVEQPSPEGFAVAIKRLIQDPQLCESMSFASRKRASFFTWPSIARQYTECYQEVLRSTRGRFTKENSCVL